MSDQYYEVDNIIRVQGPTRKRPARWFVSYKGYGAEHNRYVLYEELSEDLQALYFKNGKKKKQINVAQTKRKTPDEESKESRATFDHSPPLEVEEGPVNPDGSIQLIRPAKKPKVIDHNFLANATLFSKYIQEYSDLKHELTKKYKEEEDALSEREFELQRQREAFEKRKELEGKKVQRDLFYKYVDAYNHLL